AHVVRVALPKHHVRCAGREREYLERAAPDGPGRDWRGGRDAGTAAPGSHDQKDPKTGAHAMNSTTHRTSRSDRSRIHGPANWTDTASTPDLRSPASSRSPRTDSCSPSPPAPGTRTAPPG